MESLIKIEERNGEQLVSGRDLHEFLEGSERFSKWWERMISYGFEENKDYTPYQKVHPQNKQEYTDYLMKISMAKEISMIQRTDKGKQARLYFIECEKKLKEITQQKLPTTYLEALKELVVKEEALLLANQTIKEQQPKVEYHDTVLRAEKLSTMTEIAKDLGMSAIKLNQILHELHIQYKKGKSWFLYAEYEKLVPSHFDYHITEFGQTLKVKEIGRKWIIELLKSKNII